ncbi:hypothetical protein Tco_0077482, partial [Tanacetum coccineum]
SVMSSDSASSEEPDLPEATPASPDYVLGLEEPKHQPYVDDAPIALSSGYVADSDPEEDPKEDSEDSPVDYPADGGDDDGDDDSSNDDEEEDKALEEEEEEHLAFADSVVASAVDPVPSSEEIEPFKTDESATTPPPPPADHTTPLATRIFECLARCLAALALPSSPLPKVPHLYGSPNHVHAPRRFRATIGRLRASSPSTHHPLHPSPPLLPLPSSPYLPPLVPTSLPLPSPPLPASLFIPPPVNHREDILKAELPPHKRLCLTALTSRFEVWESSTATARPTRGHRADYGFIDTLDAETKLQRAEEVGYGIRDVWVDPIEAVEEVVPTTLEGVNARVTELPEVQEEDTQDLYALVDDAQDRQTRLSQRVNVLIEDREFHQETVLLMEQEALVSQEAWVLSVGLSLAVHHELHAYRTHIQIQDYRIASQESFTATLVAHI